MDGLTDIFFFPNYYFITCVCDTVVVMVMVVVEVGVRMGEVVVKTFDLSCLWR